MSKDLIIPTCRVLISLFSVYLIFLIPSLFGIRIVENPVQWGIVITSTLAALITGSFLDGMVKAILKLYWERRGEVDG